MISKENLEEVLKRANFKEEQINRILNKKITTLLKRGNEEEIESILKLLNEHKISQEAIERCLTVLAKGKAKEIEEIFKVLDKHEISQEAIEGCLYVLARGKAKEIEKIFEVLDKHKISQEAIEDCLSVLARGKAEEIEKIFEVLDEHKINQEAIESCLYVLAVGKSKEIEKIFEVLDKHKISQEAIERCLTVLAQSKAKKIEEILKILENNNIGQEVIQDWLTILIQRYPNAQKLQEVFSDNAGDKNIHFRNIRMYIKLRQMNNRYLSIEEVQEICQEKHISIKKFIEEVVLYPARSETVDAIYDSLMKNGKIYVGGSTQINNSYLEEHGEELIELSRKIAYAFKKRNPSMDISEIESEAMDVIVNKCGNLVNNLENNPEILKVSILKLSILLFSLQKSKNSFINLHKRKLKESSLSIAKPMELLLAKKGLTFNLPTFKWVLA